ncbi:hypothetical protein GW796_09330 [archaeon]|nr:hypothetical protein [archaeon]NCT58930.1 hypothetical protein [archaeon]
MPKITKKENLGKFAIKNGYAYEGKIGFDKDGNTVVKWYKITGHRGAQIEFFVRRENKKIVFGKEVVAYD